MKKFFLILLFPLLIQAQLLTETFSSFVANGISTKTSHYWVLDSVYVAANSGKITTDRESSSDLTFGGSFPRDQSAGNNPFHVGGNGLSFETNDQLTQTLTDVFYGCRVVFKPSVILNAAASSKFLLHLEGGFYGIAFGATSAGVTDEIVLLTDAGNNRSYWASATDSISALRWHVLVMQWDGAKYQVWLDGAEKTTSTTGTPAALTMDTAFRIAVRADNTAYYTGLISDVKIYDQQITDEQVKEETFCAPGWTSLSGGVTRADSADGWRFHQGIVADTVYYAAAITAGSWSVTVNVDGAAGGESLKVLTSANASNWSTIGTVTATISATDYTVTGSGLGYIGFGLASGTVYLDNVSVSLTQDADREGYARAKNLSKYKRY